MTASRHLTENLNYQVHQKEHKGVPRKVIFCWNYLEWGGAQVYFLGIASRIKDRAEVVTVFPKGTGRQLYDFCETLQIPYETLPVYNDLDPAPDLWRKFQRRRRKSRAEREMLKFLDAQDLSGTVVHVELAPWQSLLPLVRLSLKTKVFVTMHNRLPKVAPWRRLIWKLKFSIIARFENFHIFASNEDTKESLRNLVPVEFLEKIKVTYTNVNPDEIDEALRFEFDREALLAKFSLPTDKFLVFCVGQFIDRKGRWTLLEAARTLKEKGEEIAFVWVSNSVLNENELERVRQYGVEKNFFLLDSAAVGREHLELMKFLRLADCFTLPSFQEGLPISLLEAMALGIPSISTDVNAIPEAIRHQETGLLIEAGDAPALAKSILKIKNDRKLARELSANGRRHVLANFNEKNVAEIAFSAYGEAFKNNR